MILSKIFVDRKVPVNVDKEKAKELGQYFTNFVVAEYMAQLISLNADTDLSKELRILDAGAGDGVLAISAVLHCVSLGYKNIYLRIYEKDEKFISDIKNNIEALCRMNEMRNIEFEFLVKCEDFILNRPDKSEDKFDICIINPPYFKYSAKDSKYSKATVDLFKGDPNIYASFMAVSLACLNNYGQLISITPRSFTNGLYFKGFRQYMLSNSRLEKIHIFKSRDKVFSDSSVLQENIICKFVKGEEQKDILIASSHSDQDIYNEELRGYKNSFIVDSSDDLMVIHIPENENDADTMKKANKLPTKFIDSGYYISTGPVVEHRSRRYILEEVNTPSTVPLLRPHNVKSMEATWSGSNKKDVSYIINEDSKKFLLSNNTYVLLKRFSSKDEKKRLVAGVYSPILGNSHIGFGNKLNYVGLKDADLNYKEALGLSAVLNSTFMDNYFRCISGNTQVNATDIRSMKFPTREMVCKISEELLNISITQDIIDRIVTKYLFPF